MSIKLPSAERVYILEIPFLNRNTRHQHNILDGLFGIANQKKITITILFIEYNLNRRFLNNYFGDRNNLIRFVVKMHIISKRSINIWK